MWENLLYEMKAQAESYGDECNVGASQEELANLVKAVKNELDVDVPAELLWALEMINGFEFNGVIFYGIDEKLLVSKAKTHINGLIQNNQVWYENEWQKKYLFIGNRDISWYVFDIDKKRYYELDLPSGDVVTSFHSFDDMLYRMLADAIDE